MEKKEIIVGIKKAAAKKKIMAAPEKFFREAGLVWIEIYGNLLPPVDGEKADPDFWNNGAEKKNMKLILSALRQRAEKKNIEWTAETMKVRLRAFLLKAWDDRFISANFMLRIIALNRIKIFNNQITAKKNGTISNRSNLEGPAPAIKPKGGFGKL